MITQVLSICYSCDRQELESKRRRAHTHLGFLDNDMSAENNIEELIKQVTSHTGVQGFIIVNNEGIPIRHSFADSSRLLAIQYSALLQNLAQKAKAAIHELEPTNDLVFLRLRSKKHEILVAPESKYLLIVIQSPVVQ